MKVCTAKGRALHLQVLVSQINGIESIQSQRTDIGYLQYAVYVRYVILRSSYCTSTKRPTGVAKPPREAAEEEAEAGAKEEAVYLSMT